MIHTLTMFSIKRSLVAGAIIIVSASFSDPPVPLVPQPAAASVKDTVSMRLPAFSSNYASGYAKDTALLNARCFSSWEIPSYSDEFYSDRIQNLGTTIPLTYNKEVRKFIEFYTTERRLMMTRVIGRSYDYFPVLEEALGSSNMPLELKNLAVIESALDSNALSRCGALGMWQFMPSTARLYKLKVSPGIDERRDVGRSTIAAIQFLKQLHTQYGDWLLALAAYNAGPGRVNQALKATTVAKGKKKDFWAIKHKLPKETQEYVPGFIAMCYLMQHYHEHNLKAVNPAFLNMELTPVRVNRDATLQEIAAHIPITPEEIAFFNPELGKERSVKASQQLMFPSAVIMPEIRPGD